MEGLRSTRGLPLTASVVAAALLLAGFAPGSPVMAQDLDGPGAVEARIAEQRRLGNYVDARRLAEQYVADSKARFGEETAEHAAALESLAETHFAQSRLAEAEPLYARVIGIRDKVLGPASDLARSSVAMLAEIYRQQGRAELSEPLINRLIAAEEGVVPPEPAAMAGLLRRLAAIQVALKRLGDAETTIRRALALVETADGNRDAVSTAELLAALASVESAQGKPGVALATLQRAASLLEQASSEPGAGIMVQAIHIKALAQMAALNRQLDRMDAADALIARIAALTEAMMGPDHPLVATALDAVAGVYERQGRLAEAEMPRKRALEINERAHGADDVNVAGSLRSLGNLYKLQYRFNEAMLLLKRGLAIAEAKLEAGHPDLTSALVDAGELHLVLRQWGDAEALLNRALASSEAALDLESVPAAEQAIRVLQGLAFLEAFQHRVPSATQYLVHALALSERALGPAHETTGGILAALGVHALSEDRLDEAEKLFERARPISELAGRERQAYANAMAGLGLVHFKRSDWVKAHEALGIATSVYISLEQRAAAAPAIAGPPAAGRPVALDELFLTQAVAAYRVAASDPGKAADLGDEAFRLSQRTQGTQAAGALGQMAARFGSGSGALSRLVREHQDLARAWRAMDRQLTAALAQPPHQRDAPAEAALRQHLRTAAARLDQIDDRLGSAFPEYATLSNPQPIGVDATQDMLGDGEALVFIASLPNESLVWVIDRNKASMVLVPLGKEQLAREVAALRCGLDQAAWTGDAAVGCAALLGRAAGAAGQAPDPLPFDLERAHALYRTLLAPVEKLITGRHLLLVAVGPLASLPLSVLVTEKPSAIRYAEAAWLTRRHAITTLPSVASLAALRRTTRSTSATRPFAGFGNPLLSGRRGNDRSAWARQSCAIDAARPGGRRLASSRPPDLAQLSRGRLPMLEALRRQDPLPETALEICAVARVLGAAEGDVHLGARAMEGRVKELSEQGALATYRVVHLATHGLLAAETASVGARAEPSLLMTPPDAATDLDDGLLTASEVAELRLDAEWVILSACNTASAESGETEALSGLARAFFYAGARALLVSHWYVDSEAAVRIVTRAFAEIGRQPEIGRAEAVRRAMLALTRDATWPQGWTPAAHPAIWAPFVVVGEGGVGR